MSLKSQVQDDVDKVFLNSDDYADKNCFYNGGTQPINASFNYNDTESAFSIEGEKENRNGDVLVSKTDITSRPQRGDTITNEEGDTFTVEKIISESPASYTLQIVEKTRKSLGALQRK